MANITDIYDQLKQLDAEIYTCDHMSYIFNEVGNEKVSIRLKFMAKRLSEVKDSIAKIVSDSVADQVRASSEATTNMINGVMAGIEIATS